MEGGLSESWAESASEGLPMSFSEFDNTFFEELWVWDLPIGAISKKGSIGTECQKFFQGIITKLKGRYPRLSPFQNVAVCESHDVESVEESSEY